MNKEELINKSDRVRDLQNKRLKLKNYLEGRNQPRVYLTSDECTLAFGQGFTGNLSMPKQTRQIMQKLIESFVRDHLADINKEIEELCK